MEAWFISDIHIRTPEERNSQILLRFLRSLATKDPEQTQLFLLGDIFDLWIGGHQYFANKFSDLIQALKTLKQKGMQITYIEGNHDVHIESFFHKKLGIPVFVDPQYIEINGMTLRLEHGDLINQNDEVYLKYRRKIRSPFVKPLGNLLPGVFWDIVGTRASKKSRLKSMNYRMQNEDELIQMIRDHAIYAYTQKPFDIIISGHMHIFDDHNLELLHFENKKIRSINLGSWFEDPVKVLNLKDKEFNWENIY